ncbi:MAG: hypothetical protein K2I18_08715 [Paramuribaculum sp.]|nr:hypothetical protein [Paramuribaculum sp.]
MTTNIATTKEQSARLLQCGVSAESADMHWHGAIVPRGGSLASPPEPSEEWDLFNSPYGFMPEEMQKAKLMEDYNEIIPAWSLSALLDLLPEKIEDGYWLTIQKCNRGKNASVHYGIAYFKCKWDNPEDISNSTITTLGRLKYFTDCNLIEAVCKMIEWLTANNYKLNQL